MDSRLERWINAPAGTHAALDAVMLHAALWGEALFIAIVALWFLVGWVRGSPRDRQGAITALCAAGIALLANQVLAHLWVRPRPFVSHPASVHLLAMHAADPSFPSDHAAAAFAIAAVLLACHRRLGSVCLLLAALICYARVYAGIHYPGDVAAGALIGLAAALILVLWCDALMRTARRWVDRAMVAIHLPLPGEPAGGSVGVRGR